MRQDLIALRREVDSYQSSIFSFGDDFTLVDPDEDGFYLTIRCGLTGIYQILDKWHSGAWQLGILDGSRVIARSRVQVVLKNL